MNAVDDDALEALVDGELTEADRTELLRSLEADGTSWRRLAMAFLADQALRQALRPHDGGMGARAMPVLAAAQPPARQPERFARRLRWARGLAACLVCAALAFLAGVQVGRPDVSMDARGTGNRAPADEGSQVQMATHPVGPLAPPSSGTPIPTLSPNARRELERMGFIVVERPRVLSVRRQDGQPVPVLVNEIELQFVGRPSTI